MVGCQQEVRWVLMEEDGRLSIREGMGFIGGNGRLLIRGGMGLNGGRW